MCVVIKSLLFDLLEFLSSDTFGNVSIVIRDHFKVKGLAVSVGGIAYSLHGGNDSLTLVSKFLLNLCLVLAASGRVLLILLVLLNGRHCSPC